MQQLKGLLGGGLGSTLALDLKIAAIGALLGLSAAEVVAEIEQGHITSITDLPAFVEHELERAVQEAEQQFGKPLWELLVRAPAGLDGAQLDNGQAADAVKMVQRMLGFGMALPMLTARLETLIKGILGPHAPDGLLKAIRELPNEIGVNFFIGTVLERIFETAVATPLEEAIARQTHPARFDFRVIKVLLTKHHINEAEAKEYLLNIGYREVDLEHILALDESFLSVADIQALYLLGRFTEAQATTELQRLGYGKVDAAHLIDLYMTHAETQGGQQLRATARGGYLDGHITAAEYRHLLEVTNTPARSIDLELESADLQLSWGRRQLSVLNIKQLHQQGHINDRQAELDLTRIGFTEDDARQLIQTWTVEKRTTHPGLTVNRILSYQLGGVITRPQSLALLQATGLRVEDASLLAANPGHMGGVFAHELTPATVLSALKEGVLGVEDAKAKLDALNVEPAERDLSIAATIAKAVRGPKPKAAHRTLSEAHVLEALKLQLVSSSWAAAELATLGYDDASAQVVLAIETTRLRGAPPDGWVTLS
jgi:hypothetical protein